MGLTTIWFAGGALAAFIMGIIGFGTGVQIAVFSMFCWTSGLMLGSSVVLKTASWDVLWPLTLGWFLLASLVPVVVSLTLLLLPKGKLFDFSILAQRVRSLGG